MELIFTGQNFKLGTLLRPIFHTLQANWIILMIFVSCKYAQIPLNSN